MSPQGAGGSLQHWLCVAAMITAPLLAGCRETLTEVESGIVESGTWAALGIEQALPRLGDFVAIGRGGAEEIAIVDRWEASWDHGAAPRT